MGEEIIHFYGVSNKGEGVWGCENLLMCRILFVNDSKKSCGNTKWSAYEPEQTQICSGTAHIWMRHALLWSGGRRTLRLIGCRWRWLVLKIESGGFYEICCICCFHVILSFVKFLFLTKRCCWIPPSFWGKIGFLGSKEISCLGGTEACVQFLLMFLWYWDLSNKIPWKMFIFIIPQGKNCPNTEFIDYFWLTFW